MRRWLIAGVLLLVLGAGLFAVGLVAGVLGGGVPYHDGPNAGHTSAPGFGRVLEESAAWLMLGGVGVSLIGAVLAGIGIAARLVARRNAGKA